MSELKQEGLRRWRRFSEEFKRDSLRLVVEDGYTFKAAATPVGVSDQTLHRSRRRVPKAKCPISGLF